MRDTLHLLVLDPLVSAGEALGPELRPERHPHGQSDFPPNAPRVVRNALES
jgi:hypothetical protein